MKKLYYMALTVAGILSAAAALAAMAERTETAVSGGVLRFHVLANSDAESDQALKLRVRDAVLAAAEPLLAESGSAEQSAEIIGNNLELIETAARAEIAAGGFAYHVRARVTRDVFPTKEYGGARFPSGEYTALRVEIGEAAGRNWWCVMFPPLCFARTDGGEMPEESKAKLEESLPDDAYSLVTGDGAGIRVKFKLVELLGELSKH
ncbi:MAG: stage II sporulation protein R [Clostridiales bacterium]|jgi:stage II sporulation protein R|nr:stage II sporulation protein R [Clostridiales bacterium]